MPAERPLVLVDGSNVRRSLWPNLTPEQLVELCGEWARERGAEALVVFDGAAPASGGACSVLGSGAESADTVLERLASRSRVEGRPFWLVTSDRELRVLAGEGAERVVGGGAFARELTGRGR